MVTIVRGRLPAAEFALQHTLDALPDFEFEVERIVDTGEERVMPLVWVRGTGAEEIERALREDPTVDAVAQLAAFEDEWLYEMAWIDHVHLLVMMLTNAKATILDAYGNSRGWKLRVMYPDRDSLSRTHEFCADHGLTFDVESVRDLEGEPAGRYGLTAEQYEALTAATKRGFFEVPRRTTLAELAEEFDVSHQALSERVRRATGALVEDTLLVGPEED